MVELARLRLRPPIILAIGVVIFAVSFWLRAESHDLFSHYYHLPGTPGTDLDASYTDSYWVEACVEAARAGLVPGTALCAMAAVAWLFVPSFRPAEAAEVPSSRPLGDAAPAA